MITSENKKCIDKIFHMSSKKDDLGVNGYEKHIAI